MSINETRALETAGSILSLDNYTHSEITTFAHEAINHAEREGEGLEAVADYLRGYQCNNEGGKCEDCGKELDDIDAVVCEDCYSFTEDKQYVDITLSNHSEFMSLDTLITDYIDAEQYEIYESTGATSNVPKRRLMQYVRPSGDYPCVIRLEYKQVQHKTNDNLAYDQITLYAEDGRELAEIR